VSKFEVFYKGLESYSLDFQFTNMQVFTTSTTCKKQRNEYECVGKNQETIYGKMKEKYNQGNYLKFKSSQK
jgi:hypothetical protein